MKVNKLKQQDPKFPLVLKSIHDAPDEIYWAGAPPIDWLELPRVAVVGSRKSSPYGRQVTQKIVSELARAGVVIISGLALGIDSVAHKAALEVGGITIAVLPTSLGNIYPVSHTNLAKEIINSGGAIVSEYRPGSTPFKGNFIARNRIVSGLSDGVLITEAALRSGTLTTVRYALDQGKTVMAVPGNITSPSSEGTNNIIKSGGTVVTEASDVFAALNISLINSTSNNQKFKGNKLEEKVVRTIAQGIGSQEEIATILGLDGGEINSILTSLEINGHIKPAGGGNWFLN